MNTESAKKWKSKRTTESRKIEKKLKELGYHQVDSYRYNSASIRVRIIDDRFATGNRDKWETIVEKDLVTLPEETRRDIVYLLLLAPSELAFSTLNAEFENPSPSML